MDNFTSLEHKLLNQHHDEYTTFTRLILSLAVGSFSLLAALSSNLLTNANSDAFAKATFPILLVSILAGLFVQHRIMMNPIWHLERACELVDQQNPNDATPIKLRRNPSKLEYWFYRVQVLSFLAAFVVLSIFMLCG
jgi:hypothetical protein